MYYIFRLGDGDSPVANGWDLVPEGRGVAGDALSAPSGSWEVRLILEQVT